MTEPEAINIPAYKRKRSISARARKKPSYLKPKKTTRRKRVVTRRTIQPAEPTPDIPVTQVFPSEELFEEPIIDDYPTTSSDLRQMKICGKCDGYFDNIEVGVVQLTSVLRIGDTILFETNDGLFEQVIESMQIDRKDVRMARSGSDIGLKVAMEPMVGGNVYKVI